MQGVKQPGITCMPGVARERLLHDQRDDGDNGDDHNDHDDDHDHHMIMLKLVMMISKLESKET